MEIELKHIAPYLNYSLKVHSNYNNREEKVVGLDKKTEGFEIRTIDANKKHVVWHSLPSEFKPLLRPLSQLTEANLIHAGFESHIDWLTNEREHWIKTYGYEGMINQVPYIYVTWLLKNHYDIFNLIDNNLAIAIHDEPQKENQPI